MKDMKPILINLLAEKLNSNKEALQTYWKNSKPVKHVFLDDVFPTDIVLQLYNSYPKASDLLLRNSLRERKRVGVQLDKYDSIVADFQYCFLDEKILNIVESITNIKNLAIDPSFYASGISVMAKNDFLNPHLDNSHDGDRNLYRVINSLYYCSPEWKIEDGGNLELWDTSLNFPEVIHSKFNRLVLMETNETSWHSVQKIKVDKQRNCVSNYYFSQNSGSGKTYFNVTSFKGRPNENIRNLILILDSFVRNTIRKLAPNGIKKTQHRFGK
jgi:Rps23 Pro-64 3,4-dihydroxylase Tpa1-like proline 4-hydroxylase